MNWLQKTSQAYNLTDLLSGMLNNTFDINWVSDYIKRTYGTDACDEIAGFGRVNNEANAIASTLMRELGCGTYPEAPGAQPPNQTYMPPNMPVTEQEEVVDVPSTSII